jgi:hypothetical protein
MQSYIRLYTDVIRHSNVLFFSFLMDFCDSFVCQEV